MEEVWEAFCCGGNHLHSGHFQPGYGHFGDSYGHFGHGHEGAEEADSRAREEEEEPGRGHVHEEAADTAERLERRANDMAAAGNFGIAAQVFARAADFLPSARVLEARAQCLMELDDDEGARSAALRATQLRPEWHVGHATLGRALLNLGKLQDAANSLGRAAELAKGTEEEEELAEESREVQDLLERHWMEHHDIVLPLPQVPRGLRIRQCFECSYCHLTGEQGPGGAVWAAGVVLSQTVAQQGPSGAGEAPSAWSGLKVLELGAGTGAAGLAAAATGAEVMMTDQDPLLFLLELNTRLNAATLQASGGSACSSPFCWTSPPPEAVANFQRDVVIGADLVYSFASVEPFAAALAAVLKEGKECSALYAHNPRSPELDEAMHKALESKGLRAEPLPLPQLQAVGRIEMKILQRVVLLRITVLSAREDV